MINECIKKPSFLRDSSELLNLIKHNLLYEAKKYVYIVGCAGKFVLNDVLSIVRDKQLKIEISVVLQSLKDIKFTSPSLLYLINKPGQRVRISSRAAHNLIVTDNCLVLVSVASEKLNDNRLCGVVIYDKDELKKAVGYCQDLWDNGFPLHFQQQN